MSGPVQHWHSHAARVALRQLVAKHVLGWQFVPSTNEGEFGQWNARGVSTFREDALPHFEDDPRQTNILIDKMRGRGWAVLITATLQGTAVSVVGNGRFDDPGNVLGACKDMVEVDRPLPYNVAVACVRACAPKDSW